MAKFLLQQSLRLVRPSATNLVCRRMFGSKLREEAMAMAMRVDEKGKLPSKSIINNSSPWLMLPGEYKEEEEMMVHKFYSLSEDRVITMNDKSFAPDPDAHCVGSSNGWLGFINRRPDFDFFLLNPITGRSIKLPSIRKLNFVQEIERDSFWDAFKKDAFWKIFKFVKSSPNPDAKDCRLLIHFRNDSSRWLAFCCPGLGDADNDSSSWTLLPGNYISHQYMNFEYSPKDNRFFAMLRHCYTLSYWESDGNCIEMESWDLSDPRNPKKYPVLPSKRGRVARTQRFWESDGPDTSAHCLIKEEEYRERYHVHHKSCLIGDPSLSGQLFWIDRFTAHDNDRDDNGEDDCTQETLWTPEVGSVPVAPYMTLCFDVYKFDTCYSSGRKLEYMESLGDGALFIGSNGGFRLSAKDFPELKPNSIYFTDDIAKIYFNKTIGGHDIGIYNYQDKTMEGCYYPVPAADIKKYKDIDPAQYKDIDPAPVWFTRNPRTSIDD